MCTLHDFSVLKSNLFIRAPILDRILVTEKTTRTPRVHLVLKDSAAMLKYIYHDCYTVLFTRILWLSLKYITVNFYIVYISDQYWECGDFVQSSDCT